MSSSSKIGVLLVNLGTPASPDPSDVYRYLIEFLTDPRVIDYSWPIRQALVRALIVPLRYKNSAQQYKTIWTDKGSPLMVYSKNLAQELQVELGEKFHVALAMRYQEPSLEGALKDLMNRSINQLIVLPLFPQYASATTGSIHQKIMELIQREQVIPNLHFIQSFATHPAFIDAWVSVASEYCLEEYDHYLFSFHGLPARHIRKADRAGCCFQAESCCGKVTAENEACYRAQCYATARAIAERLKLLEKSWSVCFQSRLGREKWLQPYALDVIPDLAKAGTKKLLFFSPSFVCDCLETIYEASIDYADVFREAGGSEFQLVRGLNDHPAWINAVKELVLEQVPTELFPDHIGKLILSQ